MEVHGKDLKTWNENDINALLSIRNEKKVVENVRDVELKNDESENKIEEKIAEDNTVSDLEVKLINNFLINGCRILIQLLFNCSI